MAYQGRSWSRARKDFSANAVLVKTWYWVRRDREAKDKVTANQHRAPISREVWPINGYAAKNPLSPTA